MRGFTRLLSLIGIAASLVMRVSAHDLTPPPWRGAMGSTFQHWMFNQQQTGNWSPEQVIQTPPLSQQPFLQGGTFGWTPGHMGMTGVISIPSGGTISFFIPNYGVPEHHKFIRVQLTWFSGVPGTTVQLPSGGIVGGSVTTVPLPGTVWNHSTVDFELASCPDFEITLIKNLTNEPVFLDQVVIDTLCTPVPEPATMAVLGIGGVALLRRRRRS